MDRRVVEAGLKEIPRNKVEAVGAGRAKLLRKQEAATRKFGKERAMQQKKAAREAQALLDTQCGIFCS